MGSAASKATRAAASNASKRQYPTRPPPTSNPPPQSTKFTAPAPEPATVAGPTVHPAPSAHDSKDQTISRDAQDPDFAASLRSLGPVQPNSTMSNTSTFSAAPNSPLVNDPSPPSGSNIFPSAAHNPALQVLQARERIAEEAEEEFASARRGVNTQRQFLDIQTIRQVLVMRDRRGFKAEEIEKELGLKHGVVASLGAVAEGRTGRRTADEAGIY